MKTNKVILTGIFMFVGLLSLSFGQKAILNNYQRGVFLEVGGNSVGYSVNLEQVLVNNAALALTWRIGAGATSLDAYAPLGLQLVFLKGKHHLVFSPTATARVELAQPFRLERSDTFLHLQAGIGYRFQSRNSRIFGQIQVVPGFQLDPTRTQITESAPVLQSRIGAAIGLKL